jgi:hypothetical protein
VNVTYAGQYSLVSSTVLPLAQKVPPLWVHLFLLKLHIMPRGSCLQ